MNILKLSLSFGALALCTLTSTGVSFATDGVTDTHITLGVSNAQDGPAQALGLGVTEGIQVYFNKVNASGGVHGRKLDLKILNDGYEPTASVKNTLLLIKKEKVFALMGYVGTPTSKAVMPVAVQNKKVYFAPFTGAGFLRNPVNPYVFNVRGSYTDETVGIIDHFVKDKGYSKIGLFMQNDSYGQAGQAGVLEGLKKHNLELAGLGTYERNTTDVSAAVEALKNSGAEAIIMVGAYKACAAFMKAAQAAGLNPDFANISFVGTSALIKESGAAGEGSYISQVMPNPYTSDLAIAKQYRADMAAAGKEPEFTSLEGYVQAAVLVEALKKAGKGLNDESFLAALNSLDVELGGLHVKFSPDNHQALSKVYFTQVKGGKPVSIDKF